MGENVTFVAYRAGALKIICRVLCDNALVVAPNKFKPLYTTVSGRCLLAGLDERQLANVTRILGFPGELWGDIDTMEKLMTELRGIRETGRSEYYSEKRLLGGIGYILDAPAKFAPLAIGSTMPLFRYKEKRGLLETSFRDYAVRIALLLQEIAG